MKTFHEAPKSIFKHVQSRTDGDYFLVHLFETDTEYLNLAREAIAKGREVILDNSIFELGTAFDMEKFALWVNYLKPTYYIVPDSLDDMEGTIKNMYKWTSEYKSYINPQSKMIGVIQGKNYEELSNCYEYMDKEANVDKIAFSFDCKWYSEIVPHKNKLVSWMMGRRILLSRLLSDGIINTSKPHHLLGAGLVEEFKFYDKDTYSWIDSVDTSSPVIYGMNKSMYDYRCGNTWKPSEKLHTLINAEISHSQMYCIEHNIKVFKNFCSGEWYDDPNI